MSTIAKAKNVKGRSGVSVGQVLCVVDFDAEEEVTRLR
jgi:hypothetical protein